MAELYFDYGFGSGGLGGRIYHGKELVLFTPDPERFEKEKSTERSKKVR